jgi:hypothetical protein
LAGNSGNKTPGRQNLSVGAAVTKKIVYRMNSSVRAPVSQPARFKPPPGKNQTLIQTNQTNHFMKQLLLTTALVAVSLAAFAQDDKAKKMASPPAKAEGTIDGVKITIDYHQPSAKGREIMGGLVPFGQVWRTGANATTSIELGANAKIEGQSIAKGKYGLYTIPGEAEWTIIINKDIKWGSYDYNEKNDVLRVKVKPAKTPAFVETFTISVEKETVTLRWENTSVSFRVAKG